MKTQNLLRIGMLPLLALVIFACQKDLKAPSLTSNAKPVTTQGDKTPLDISLSYSTDQLIVGEEVTVNFVSVPEVECGQGFIEWKVDEFGNPTYDGSGTYAEVDKDWLVQGYPSYTFTPDQEGFLSFRAHFVPAGQGCNEYAETKFEETKTVIAECTPGISARIINPVKENEVNGQITYKLTLEINITDCGQGLTGKLQGGLVSGAEIIDGDGTTEGYSYPNPSNASVINWQPATAGTYLVTYYVTKSAGLQDVTGEWKFSYDGGEFNFDKLYFDFE